MYPVMLNPRGKRCLVVGGGVVALRKVERLVAEGALITVVASRVVEPIDTLARTGEIVLKFRPYEPGEAASFSLAFAATDDKEVNRRVFEDADAAGVWVNVADDPDLCTFHLPASVKRGSLSLSVASSGEAPFVVRRLRQLLERRIGPEWAEWIHEAAIFRKKVRETGASKKEQEISFDLFFNSTVNKKELTARVPSQEEEALWLPPKSEAACKEPDRGGPLTLGVKTEGKPGFVSLVGAGPGDAGLMTVRGRQRMMAADAIVYDRLAATALPCDLRPEVELHCVGKSAGRHPVPQAEIEALLVKLAGQGKRVVRLKGGDPFIFGRGGEEAEALVAANILFEVVPCLTAATAVPAYAGIPITHRQEAASVTLVTAHESQDKQRPEVRWDLLAADPNATIVGYMGVTSLPRTVERLLGFGMAPNTPAAIVERGTTSRQRSVRSELSKLPKEAVRQGIKPPALFVIGPVVKYSEALDWFGSKPLCKERIVVVAPAGEIGEALEISGAEVVEIPMPVTPAARVVIGALPITGCVIKNADEADLLDDERDGPGWSSESIAWCLSQGAIDRAREIGWPCAEPVEGEPIAEALATAIAKR